MIGIELKQKVQDKLAELLEHRIIALPAGPNVIRMLPPLVDRKGANRPGGRGAARRFSPEAGHRRRLIGLAKTRCLYGP